jgi:hypothetical protein
MNGEHVPHVKSAGVRGHRTALRRRDIARRLRYRDREQVSSMNVQRATKGGYLVRLPWSQDIQVKLPTCTRKVPILTCPEDDFSSMLSVAHSVAATWAVVASVFLVKILTESIRFDHDPHSRCGFDRAPLHLSVGRLGN